MLRLIRVLGNRSFSSLTLAQFLAALNDNALKQIFLLLVVAAALDTGGIVEYEYQAAATAVFAVPYLLFSVWAGQVADRFSKRFVIVASKGAEVGVMLLAGYAIWVDNLLLILVALLFMATQSTFFSPSKYGILPELLTVKRLSAGNGIIQMTTYVAIMFGTALAGLLLEWYGDRRIVIASFLIVLAVVGWLVTYLIEPLPAADPDRSFRWNLFSHFKDNMSWIGRDRYLFVCVLGFALAWFIGTILTLNLNVLGMDTLGLDYLDTSLLLVYTGMGMAVGSLLAGWWSGEGVEVGLAVPGAVGMGISLLLLTDPPSLTYAGGILFGAGVFGGLYLIPLLTALQEHPDPELKGEVLATANVFTFGGMILSSGLYAIMVGVYDWSAPEVMGALGWSLLALALVLPVAHPRFIRRFIRIVFVALGRILYRLRFRGAFESFREDNQHDRGTLVVSNHMTYLDWWFLGLSFHRIPRYVIHGRYHEVPLLGWALRFMNTIPIDPRRPKQTGAALDEMERQLEDGQLVVIFPEGEVSRIGQMLGVRPGVKRFIKNPDIDVLPVYLDNLWGRWWSYSQGELLFKWPRKIFRTIPIWLGEPIETPRTREDILRELQLLETRARTDRLSAGPPPVVRFLKSFRRRFYEPAGLDGVSGDRISRGKMLISTLVLAKKLDDLLGADEERVGVMVPPSLPGLSVNLALNLIGRSAVNLNPLLSRTDFQTCLNRAQVRRILTVPQVLDRVDFEVQREIVDLSELRDEVAWTEVAGAVAKSLLPAGVLCWITGGFRDPLDEHSVIFTSGTTGTPKGVRISGLNLLSNLTGLRRVFGLDSTDRVVLVLPLYHSFGYAAGVWGPALGYCEALYHHDPREIGRVRELVEEEGGTVMIGVPTLYRMLLERKGPDMFRSTEILLSGSEPLPEDLAGRFQDEVDVPLLNGYGLTEMTPGVSVNVPDYKRSDGGTQEGIREGSVGRALPGVAIRIVDRERDTILSFDESGEIQTRGPGLMLGYLEKTVDGEWWATGDRGRLDEDGFLYVEGRYERFSNRGGELISHRKVEDRLLDLLHDRDVDSPEVAVLGLGESGSERLVLLTNVDLDPDEIHRLLLDETDLPNASVPHRDRIFSRQSIPRQSMGGLDLEALNDLAKQLVNK